MTALRGRSPIDDMTRANAFRASVLSALGPTARDYVQDAIARAERRRPLANYNTGTISEAAALYLLALSAWLRPRYVVEIGTFIGTSSMSLIGGHSNTRLYTCDKDNDCGPDDRRISCFPKTDSTRMLSGINRTLGGNGNSVDLFFFDGRIQPADLPLILELSNDRTVYAFDDYEGTEKGVLNVSRLHPWLNPKHEYQLIDPPFSVLDLDAKTTIALLVPRVLL